MAGDSRCKFSDINADFHERATTVKAFEAIRVVLDLLKACLRYNSGDACVDAHDLLLVIVLALTLDIIGTPTSHLFTVLLLLVLEC